MKFFILALVLYTVVLGIGIGGLVYLRSNQPKIWNVCLEALKAPGDSTTPSLPPSPSAPVQISAQPVAATTKIASTPVTPPQQAPEIVSPNSTNLQTSESPTGPTTPKSYIPPDPLPARPNWTWNVVGKVYSNVVVTQAEADRIHITYDGGVGTVNTSDLSPELQKIFNYDPQLATQAAKARQDEQAQVDAEQAPILAAQQAQAAQQAKVDQAQQAQAAQAKAATPDPGQIQWYKTNIDAGIQNIRDMEHPAVVGGSINWRAIEDERHRVYQLQTNLHAFDGEWYGDRFYGPYYSY